MSTTFVGKPHPSDDEILRDDVDPDTQDLANELERIVDGEVRFDRVSRLLYSTDASIYQITPLGVVLPRTEEDVIATVELARRHNVPVLPRGGGTSLAGQTVGSAIVLDYSKYMRRILDVDIAQQTVRVQPGIILDELNLALAPHEKMFAPDPSTTNRGNIGGALGNNSCGAHSIVWGKTSDNVLSIRTVLSDGTVAQLEALEPERLSTMARRGDLLASIVGELNVIGHDYANEIETRYPKIMRRVSGYNLDLLPAIDRNGINLAEFVVGSEGTLVNITEATLKLVPTPKYKALAVLHFSDLIESMEATVTTLELDPAAVEHVGSMILREARSNREYSKLMDWVQGDPEAVLLVELTGEAESEVTSKLDRLERRMEKAGLSYAVTRLEESADQARVWQVRRAGLGLMMNVTGPDKPLPFVEDTAVDPALLPAFVSRFDDIVKRNGTEAGYYGHASVGCLHIRPMINLKEQAGVERMASIAEEISDLVLEFQGALSGEHGDGLARSPFIEKMFGPSIMQALGRVKKAFDPEGIMNPGKIVDSVPMTNNLRIGPGYSAYEKSKALSFEREGGFASAVEMCNGQGACRKVSQGTMCPSFMATRDEEHSTRGRANALRSALSGALPLQALTGRRVGEVMDLCLGCKACKSECPSGVDMAKLKYEILGRQRQRHGASIRDRLLGNIDLLGLVGSALFPISNLALGSAPVATLMDRTIGIDRRRRLPLYAKQTFRQWLRTRTRSNEVPNKPSRGRVVLFNDTFTNYNHPEIGRSAVKVIEALGYEVIVPNFRCCGRPQLATGDFERSRRNAESNMAIAVEALSGTPYTDDSWIVGLEPSCILMFRDEYLDLSPDPGSAQSISDRTLLVDEFLAMALTKTDAVPFDTNYSKLLFHGHCQQKALSGTKPSMEVLRTLQNCEVIEVESGCCGMAGSFGFESEHYDLSMTIGRLSLFPAIKNEPGEFEVVSLGVSCRQQILDGTGRRAKHLVEILADSIPKHSSANYCKNTRDPVQRSDIL